MSSIGIAQFMISVAVSGSGACEVPDATFAGFFERFASDHTFQRGRIAARVRFGYWTGEEGEALFKWRELSPEGLSRVMGSSLVPSREARRRDFEMRRSIAPVSTGVVYLAKKESDAFLVTYHFRNDNGCWVLFGVENRSNVVWQF